MGLSDFAILEALLHKGPQAVSELGRRIDLTSGSMTTAIDRLETRVGWSGEPITPPTDAPG